MDSGSDYDCSICLQLIVEPIQLEKCKHLFCSTCLSDLGDFSGNVLKCPLCRQQQGGKQLTVNKEIQQTIQQKYPQQFEIRQKQLEIHKAEVNSSIKLKILYGNTHELVNINNNAQNKHQWSVFVKVVVCKPEQQQFLPIPDSVISEVKFELHPTFNPQIVTVKQSPYKVSRLGWGVFDIPITIKLQPQLGMNPIEVSHYLSFDNGNEQKSVPVTISHEKIQILH